MLKAMASWHVAVDRFEEIERTVTWMNKINFTGWNPGDAWKLDCLHPGELEERLASVDVLGDLFWATSLRDQEWVELSCLDLAVQAVIKFHDRDHDICAIPSHILRYPEFDRDAIRDSNAWAELHGAIQRQLITRGEMSSVGRAVDRDERKLWFFAVIHYDSDHWCAAAVNFAEFTVTVFDPQQTGNRFAALRTFLSTELIPLLSTPPPPKR